MEINIEKMKFVKKIVEKSDERFKELMEDFVRDFSEKKLKQPFNLVEYINEYFIDDEDSLIEVIAFSQFVSGIAKFFKSIEKDEVEGVSMTTLDFQ